MRFKDAYGVIGSWTSNTIKKLDDLGLEIDKLQRNGILRSAENLVHLYGLSKRKYETDKKGDKLYTFQHQLNVFSLMINYYTKNKVNNEFKEFFRNNYIELAHASLNHDTIEDKKMDICELINFYEKIKFDNPNKNANYCKILERPSNPRPNDIVQYLKRVGSDPITRYVKICDIMNNSQSLKQASGPSGNKQFLRMVDHYEIFIHDYMSELDREFRDNVLVDLSQTKRNLLINRAVEEVGIGKIL